jgi:hypothetical protein
VIHNSSFSNLLRVLNSKGKRVMELLLKYSIISYFSPVNSNIIHLVLSFLSAGILYGYKTLAAKILLKFVF